MPRYTRTLAARPTIRRSRLLSLDRFMRLSLSELTIGGRGLLRTVFELVIAMGTAGVINASMLIMAAALFNANGLTNVSDIYQAFDQLGVLVGENSAILFGVALV